MPLASYAHGAATTEIGFPSASKTVTEPSGLTLICPPGGTSTGISASCEDVASWMRKNVRRPPPGSVTVIFDWPPLTYCISGEARVPTVWERIDSGVRPPNGMRGPNGERRPRTPIPPAVNAAAPTNTSSRYRSRPSPLSSPEGVTVGFDSDCPGALFGVPEGTGPGPRSGTAVGAVDPAGWGVVGAGPLVVVGTGTPAGFSIPDGVGVFGCPGSAAPGTGTMGVPL